MKIKSQQEIIARIRLYFEKIGKGLNAVAQETGMTPRNLSMFLSVKNPHRITNKTASRLCSVYPFNINFLMFGEGELLIAETENSNFPDRTNWTDVDYISAISTVQYESKMFLVQENYLKLISSLSIFKDKDEYYLRESMLSTIFTTECQDWTKGLDADVQTINCETMILYYDRFNKDSFNELLKRYEELLNDYIIKRDDIAKKFRKDALLIKNALPEHLSGLFKILLNES